MRHPIKLQPRWLLLVITFLLVSCKEYEPKVLPPMTSDGKGTFGTFINGETWVACCPRKGPGGGPATSVNRNLPNTLAIYAENKRGTIQIILYDTLPIETNKVYLFSSHSPHYVYYSGECYTEREDMIDGKLVLSHLDYTVSGTFEARIYHAPCADTLVLTSGRFDIR